jgi:molybdopterin molybdotransferase
MVGDARTTDRELTPWASARLAAYAAPEPLAHDTVPLADALGCALAVPLRGLTPLPAFDCAALDGYAVGSTSGPWRVIGRVLAGHGDSRPLRPGHAAEVATGAPIPAGTVAVLPYESVDRDGDLVSAAGGEEIVAGRHIRSVAEDVPTGTDLAPAGTPVTPALQGLAAGVGLDVLHVRPRPRVGALITGDEIISSGRSGHGLVRDGVGPQLPGLVRWLGGELTFAMPVPDTPAGGLAAAMEAATDVEVVLTCGGAARGPADRLPAALDRVGARTLVSGVACRPGRPQRLARLADGRWLVGLPGSPYAALVAALTLLGPLVAGLTGRPLPALRTAPLTVPPPGGGTAGRTRILPVRWARGGAVEPLGRDRPGNLWGAALADALAVVRDGWAGDPVPLLELPRG